MDDYYSTYKPSEHYVTGQAPPGTSNQERIVSKKEKTKIWFVDQLTRMEGDDAFVCMMICFPLIELMIRRELNIPDEDDVTFSDNSPALNWFAKFISIPKNEARLVWDAFRNGLIHRGMIKQTMHYQLTGEDSGRIAKMENDLITIYVWKLRDSVVDYLQKHHRKLWDGTSSPLPAIYKNG